MTFAAGLASEGMIPVAAIYSSFLQRGYDQIVHDVALQSLPGQAPRKTAGLAVNAHVAGLLCSASASGIARQKALFTALP